MSANTSPDKAKKEQRRRQFTSEQKARILKKHLDGKVPISELCDAEGVQPSVIYGWLRQLYDNLPIAVQAATTRPGSAAPSRETALTKKMMPSRQGSPTATTSSPSCPPSTSR